MHKYLFKKKVNYEVDKKNFYMLFNLKIRKIQLNKAILDQDFKNSTDEEL